MTTTSNVPRERRKARAKPKASPWPRWMLLPDSIEAIERGERLEPIPDDPTGFIIRCPRQVSPEKNERFGPSVVGRVVRNQEKPPSRGTKKHDKPTVNNGG